MPATWEALHGLGAELCHLVTATEEATGPMTGADVDLTSPAHQDQKNDANWSDPATLEQPMRATLGHVELLLIAANDHLRGIGRMLQMDEPAWFAHVPVVRAVVETCSRIWYLTSVDIGPLDRVARFLKEREYQLAHSETLLGGPLSALPEALHNTAKGQLKDDRTRMLAWATNNGVPTQAGRIGPPSRPGPTDLLVEVFAAEGEDLGLVAAYEYNSLSAVAHGLPSGVSMYLQPPADGGSHGHNILTPDQVADSIRPALIVYNAAFDNAAKYFRWQIADLTPTRWAAWHAINGLTEVDD